MNKKGFTLVELLAVIALLGVIIAIVVPNMSKEITKSEEVNSDVLSTKIENASKLYAAKYYANNLVKGEKITFTLDDLENSGLLKLKASNCVNLRSKEIKVQGTTYTYDNIKSDDCYKEETTSSN